MRYKRIQDTPIPVQVFIGRSLAIAGLAIELGERPSEDDLFMMNERFLNAVLEMLKSLTESPVPEDREFGEQMTALLAGGPSG